MAGPQDLTDVVFRIVDQSRYTEVSVKRQLVPMGGLGCGVSIISLLDCSITRIQAILRKIYFQGIVMAKSMGF